MRARSGFALIAVLASAGCNSSTTPVAPYVGCGQPKSAFYMPTCTPYGVIHNFRGVYIWRDTAEYDTLLARDFVFRFIPDALSNAQDSLVRAEEMNFARHLFSTGSTDGAIKPAESISLTVDTTSSATRDSRPGHAGWIRYVVMTNLSVEKTDGGLFNITSPAVFYFKQQPAGSGAWKLAEWDDQPSGSLPRRFGPGSAGATNKTSWGSLKKAYQ